MSNWRHESEFLAHKYLLLTLSIEEAFLRESLEEVHEMLGQRGDVLLQLEALELTPEARQKLTKAIDLEDRLMGNMVDGHAKMREDLVRRTQDRRKAEIYTKKSASTSGNLLESTG